MPGNSRVAGTYQVYNGNPGSSLTGKHGYGLSIMGEKPNQLFSFVSGLDFEFSSGNAKFRDAGALKSSSFSLIAAHIPLGLKLFVIPTASSLVRPYVGGSVLFGIGSLQLGSGSLASLQKSYVTALSGYYLSAGVDLYFSVPSKNKAGFLLYTEVQMDSVRGSMAGNSGFSTSTFKAVFGLGW